jgi:zinc transport system substrate-binding protein
MKKILIYVICAALSIAALAGCAKTGQTPESGAEGRLSIVTTIFPPYDFARAVADNLADVTMLIDPGAEVHSFDPTTDDILAIQNCDVFIYIGGENDAWVDTVLGSMDTEGKTIVRLMDAVTPVEEETVEGMQHAHEEGEEHEETEAHDHEEEAEYDEHIWTSPANAILMINAIAEALCEADSGNADAYTQQAQSYTAQIQEVDDRIRAIVDAARSKLIIVADRFPFRYLADEFGLDYYAAFSGCSAESDVSAGTLAFLIDKVKEHNIQYVYTIELSNQQVAQAVCEQAGAQMLLLHSCHNVTKNDFEAGVTYLSLMQGNADNLEKGLG